MRDSLILQYTQYNNGGVVIPNATIEIHKISMPSTDAGVVATVRSDAEGKFQFVIDQPIIVRTGQTTPSPITYRLTITPSSGSSFRQAHRSTGDLCRTVRAESGGLGVLRFPSIRHFLPSACASRAGDDVLH